MKELEGVNEKWQYREEVKKEKERNRGVSEQEIF